MKKVIIENCKNWPKTIHGPMTDQEAEIHSSELNKIIDHEYCWVVIEDCDDD